MDLLLSELSSVVTARLDILHIHIMIIVHFSGTLFVEKDYCISKKHLIFWCDAKRKGVCWAIFTSVSISFPFFSLFQFYWSEWRYTWSGRNLENRKTKEVLSSYHEEKLEDCVTSHKNRQNFVSWNSTNSDSQTSWQNYTSVTIVCILETKFEENLSI